MDQFNPLPSLHIQRHLCILISERGRQMADHKPPKLFLNSDHFQDLVEWGLQIAGVYDSKIWGGGDERRCDF